MQGPIHKAGFQLFGALSHSLAWMPSKETRNTSFQKTVSPESFALSEHRRADRFDCDSFVSIHLAPVGSIERVLAWKKFIPKNTVRYQCYTALVELNASEMEAISAGFSRQF